MRQVRPPAVAGQFYPDGPVRLARTVGRFLAAAPPVPAGAARPRALIVPHAGYVYSGAAAAAAYARLAPWRDHIHRVLLLGPPHRVAIRGCALSGADAFATPLGEVTVDRTALVSDPAHPWLGTSDAAHAQEHSLEVQLPFLQQTLARFSVVPLLVAERDPQRLGAVLEAWWDDDEALIVVSTDLSHFLPYAAAQRHDQATDASIMMLEPYAIGPEEACGCHALNALLAFARTRHAAIERLALCNSGDTAGSRDRVVGYASYALH